MTHSYKDLLYHFIFTTKNRALSIDDPIFENRLYQYIGGTLRGIGGTLLEIKGMPDHVHLLVKLRTDHTVSKVAGALMANASKWVHQSFPDRVSFGWQNGYGAFTVCGSHQEQVQQYVRNQKMIHQIRSFDDEIRFFERNGGL